jgi:mannitol/fructose-specific phosphotransferase system IIA component (Ntr-type)
MEILQNLATVCQDEEAVQELNTTTDKKLIIDKLV